MTEAIIRRTAGLVLVALAAVLPVIAYSRLDAWDAELAGRSATPTIRVLEVCLGGIAIWSAIGAGLWWHRRRVTMWPVWARWAAFPGLFVAVFTCVVLAGKRNSPITLVAGAGLVAACWGLSVAVRFVTTRPVTTGLIASTLEIPFPTRGLNARLCVRNDRLVLDSLASRRKRSRDVVAVPWRALRSIELIEVDQDVVCQVSVFSGEPVANTRQFDVPPGPVLHVVGTARELLIPVTEKVGRQVVAAVQARSAGVEVGDAGFTHERWLSRVSARKTSALTSAQRRARIHHRTNYRPYFLIPVVAFLLMPLTMLSLMAAALVSGNEELRRQFDVTDAPSLGGKAGIAVLVVGALLFLYLLRFPIRQFTRFIDGQNYIEAYPEPPARSQAGTAPVPDKRRRSGDLDRTL